MLRPAAVPETDLKKAVGLAALFLNKGSNPPPQQRWKGNRQLNQLLWLLIHEPSSTVPLLEQVDLDRLTERDTVKQAIDLFCQKKPFPEVLDQVNDEDLCRVLSAASAKEGVFTPEKAPHAARQLMAV